MPPTPDTYPIQWTRNGQPVTLQLGHLTPDRKKAFCQWLKPRYLTEAWENTQLSGLDPELRRRMLVEYQAARQEVLSGGIYWTANPCVAVAVAILTEPGNLYLNRLLFGDQLADWSDEEVMEMVRAKLADEGSDYAAAIDLVMELADPKATAPKPGPSPDPTGTTGTSPPSPPATST